MSWSWTVSDDLAAEWAARHANPNPDEATKRALQGAYATIFASRILQPHRPVLELPSPADMSPAKIQLMEEARKVVEYILVPRHVVPTPSSPSSSALPPQVSASVPPPSVDAIACIPSIPWDKRLDAGLEKSPRLLPQIASAEATHAVADNSADAGRKKLKLKAKF